VAYDAELADRVREALHDSSLVREVKMFGGLSFMVNEQMVVSVGRNGDLLVRADPGDSDELLERDGASPAEMGTGRVMGDGWISVSAESIADDDRLDYWVGVAMEYRHKKAK
jgi:TfoX/Sxy family transcriptional regulator of competence genes